MGGIVYNLTLHPRELKPHPLNKKIYGTETPDWDLVDSIKAQGILEPLVIRSEEDKVILSGHRRWIAAKELNLDSVPCRVCSLSDPLDEEIALIEWNRQRKKTSTQLYREGKHLEKIESEKARRRQEIHGGTAPGIPKNTCGNITTTEEQGKTRDIVAQKLGISGKTYDALKELHLEAEKGNQTARKLVHKVDAGDATIHGAFRELEKERMLESRRQELVEKANRVQSLPETIRLINGDFFTEYKQLGENSVDCIITDPPYVKEWLDNYGAFAQAAKYVLKPGGFLIAYVGHIHLDRILTQMTPHLNYFWLCALQHSGTIKAVHSHSVQCRYKPILILQKPPLTKPKRYFNDLLEGSGSEKDEHEWQQSRNELKQLFEPFSDPGDLILDPFMGSGTVITMAKEMNRRAIGIDINTVNVKIAKMRVAMTEIPKLLRSLGR